MRLIDILLTLLAYTESRPSSAHSAYIHCTLRSDRHGSFHCCNRIILNSTPCGALLTLTRHDGLACIDARRASSVQNSVDAAYPNPRGSYHGNALPTQYDFNPPSSSIPASATSQDTAIRQEYRNNTPYEAASLSGVSGASPMARTASTSMDIDTSVIDHETEPSASASDARASNPQHWSYGSERASQHSYSAHMRSQMRYPATSSQGSYVGTTQPSSWQAEPRRPTAPISQTPLPTWTHLSSTASSKIAPFDPNASVYSSESPDSMSDAVDESQQSQASSAWSSSQPPRSQQNFSLALGPLRRLLQGHSATFSVNQSRKGQSSHPAPRNMTGSSNSDSAHLVASAPRFVTFDQLGALLRRVGMKTTDAGVATVVKELQTAGFLGSHQSGRGTRTQFAGYASFMTIALGLLLVAEIAQFK